MVIVKFKKWDDLHRWSRSHIYDEEVQPAPGVGEVRLKPIGDPLEKHLQHEDVGENLICVLQDDLDDWTLLHVDVLEGLFTHVDQSYHLDRCSVSAPNI